MYIPVFEIKDSFILKNKLQYNTSCTGNMKDLPFKMMFIDYDLARKSQSSNYENFSGVTINHDISNFEYLKFDYFDDEHYIYLDGSHDHENVFSGSTVTNYVHYQDFYVPDGTIYSVGEEIIMDVYTKIFDSGTTTWEFISYNHPETWVISGYTMNDIQWIVTGTTSNSGYNSGYTNWYVDEVIPIINYKTEIKSTGTNYIRIPKRIEDYLYNNIIYNDGYDNVYYNIESLEHVDKIYSDLYRKMLINEYSKNFTIILNDGVFEIKPKYNKEDVYFNYDELIIETSYSGDTFEYTFETNCLYNKYNLELFLTQFENVTSGTTLYATGVTNVSSIDSNYLFGDFYMNIDVDDPSFIREFTYVNVETDLFNSYNTIVSSITGNTITIITPYNFQSGEVIISVSNFDVSNIKDISNVLQKTYENYNQDEYRKLNIQTQRSVYNAYAELINSESYNQDLRLVITGLIFENKRNIMVLKVFSPADYVDERMTYEPVEIVRIGKDKKTSIPIPITEFTKGIAADEINANIYSVYLFDPNVEDVLVIDANAA